MIRPQLIQEMWNILCISNTELSEFGDPQPIQELVRYFVQNNRKHMETIGWTDNMAMPAGDIAPAATDFAHHFEVLQVNENGRARIKFTDDRLFWLLFPWLFPNGEGVPKYDNRNILSLKEHIKMLLLHPNDRRFGQSPQFIFFAADMMERIAIPTYSHRVVHPRFSRQLHRGNIYQRDEGTGEEYIREDMTIGVPHVIRSSISYKRRRFLNLMAMFRALGAPQLFLTFTCNDFPPKLLRAVGND